MKLSIIREDSDFDELFSGPRPNITQIGQPQSTKYILDLFRGFNVNPETLERRKGRLVLSPQKSEQGLIWFTHKLINGYDPLEYVKGRGNYLLTYPLECIRHFQIIQWSDGSESYKIPDEILDLTEPTENCRYHRGIEVPEGWVFSYKYEKFMGCSQELEITENMLAPLD